MDNFDGVTTVLPSDLEQFKQMAPPGWHIGPFRCCQKAVLNYRYPEEEEGAALAFASDLIKVWQQWAAAVYVVFHSGRINDSPLARKKSDFFQDAIPVSAWGAQESGWALRNNRLMYWAAFRWPSDEQGVHALAQVPLAGPGPEFVIFAPEEIADFNEVIARSLTSIEDRGPLFQFEAGNEAQFPARLSIGFFNGGFDYGAFEFYYAGNPG